MRNASCQQGGDELQRPIMALGCSEKIKANSNTSNKIFGEHIRQFLHKNNV